MKEANHRFIAAFELVGFADIFSSMARRLLIPDPENATIDELKQVSRVGSSETAARCTAIQMLLAGADRQLVCDALLVTNRALRKWIKCFNASGVDGLIVKKRPGRMAIINGQQASDLAQLIDQPQQAERTFWTAKAFHGYSVFHKYVPIESCFEIGIEIGIAVESPLNFRYRCRFRSRDGYRNENLTIAIDPSSAAGSRR